MAAFYSVIQYVPDPVADERLNAGILVFDERRVRAQFVRNWGRLQRLADHDIGFLRDFAEELVERCTATLFDEPMITPEMIRRAAATWRESIQLTEPRGSLLNLEELLRDTEKRFLVGDKPAAPHRMTRGTFRAFALKAAKHSFAKLGGEPARQLVRSQYEIQGGIDTHQFSLAIANGHPFVAAEVFSFLGVDQRGQSRDVEASAWAFEDVRKSHPDLPLAALVARDERRTATYAKAERVFKGLGVTIVPEEGVPSWANGFADRVIANLPKGYLKLGSSS